MYTMSRRLGFVDAYRLSEDIILFQDELRRAGTTPERVEKGQDGTLKTKMRNLLHRRNSVMCPFTRRFYLTSLGYLGFTLPMIEHWDDVFRNNAYIRREPSEWGFE